MIFINFLKFFHVLFALSLLGFTTYSFLFTHKMTQQKTNPFLFLIGIFALLTGTFLVHPKHFTFHTPWILTAYFLLFLFFLGIFVLNYCKNNYWRKLISIVLIILLVLIVHDAVTKLTFF